MFISLQSVLCIVFKERYMLDGNSFERVVFKVDHPTSNWQNLTFDVFRMAGRISAEWKLILYDSDAHIQGVIDIQKGANDHKKCQVV